MSEYRNIVAHRAPLNYAGSQHARLEFTFKEIASDVKFPSIFLGIPSDPFTLESSPIDALELFYIYKMNLLKFSVMCARYSPYEPLIRSIGSEEIISLSSLEAVKKF